MNTIESIQRSFSSIQRAEGLLEPSRLGFYFACLSFLLALQAHAQIPPCDSPGLADTDESQSPLKSPLARGIERIATGVDNYPKHRECFSCHHQAVPLLAFRNLSGPSFISFSWGDQADRRERILDFTSKSLEREMSMLQPAQELGGRGMTLGYALWSMSIGQAESGKAHWRVTIDGLVQKAIDTQQADGRWRIHSVRPPAASSEIMATALVVAGLNHYDGLLKISPRLESTLETKRETRSASVRKAILRAILWRSRQPQASLTEDLCGMLWLDYETASILLGLRNSPDAMDPHLTQKELEELLIFAQQKNTQALRGRLLEQQNQDGGWGYEPNQESDAYSTATAMLFLAQTRTHDKLEGPAGDPWFRNGLAHLLRTQKEDGSWHVSSRANPVQEYFDNGDPHETDQFISMQATCWAVAALASAYHNTPFPLSIPNSNPISLSP